ncbi:hypothetical protein EXIGLDRAFT_702640 [Exidia glandulosa HHB12029]|uniref:NADH dehydrogenase [ubiquinone] 1 beta subcomplex subunit 9 n=1 Tax=Exidia glandulosa HHB12029 TaxID=1314781 RepID=A0A165CFA5_EXIGL|nr:hypothetical protein EXIGLDRAFT_702640 [Exidia glandulosa HHB12029]
MTSLAAPFTAAHRSYVKSLYRRILKNDLDWVVQRDIWRWRALQIRARFESNRNVHDPRALTLILERAEAQLAKDKHPDPYIVAAFPGGTKWERNLPVEPATPADYDEVHHDKPEPVWYPQGDRDPEEIHTFSP